MSTLGSALAQSLVTGILSFAFLSLATFGIILIFRTSSTTNFAQGMLGIVGAYVASWIMAPEGFNEVTGLANVRVDNYYLWLVLSMLFGILISFAFGFLIDSVIFKNAKYTNAVTKQIITMGLVILITGLIPFVFGATISRKSFQFVQKTGTSISIGSVAVPIHSLITIILAAIILTGLFIVLKYTKWGLGVRSVASNEKVAGLLGVNTNKINSLSWAIAGALGAVSAITYTAAIGTLNSSAMTEMQINAFYSSTLGGFGSFHGPILGAAFYTLGYNLLNFFLVRISLPNWTNTILYLIILTLVLIKPYGLFGKKVIKKV